MPQDRLSLTIFRQWLLSGIPSARAGPWRPHTPAQDKGREYSARRYAEPVCHPIQQLRPPQAHL